MPRGRRRRRSRRRKTQCRDQRVMPWAPCICRCPTGVGTGLARLPQLGTAPSFISSSSQPGACPRSSPRRRWRMERSFATRARLRASTYTSPSFGSSFTSTESRTARQGCARNDCSSAVSRSACPPGSPPSARRRASQRNTGEHSRDRPHLPTLGEQQTLPLGADHHGLPFATRKPRKSGRSGGVRCGQATPSGLQARFAGAGPC